MKFEQLARYFSQIEQVSSRNQITTLLADFFSKITGDEIAMVVYLLQGQVAPLYKHIDFGIAEKMLIKGITKSLDIEKQEFILNFQKKGDLGIAVEDYKKKIPQLFEYSLTISNVFNTLKKVTESTGNGSQEIKIGLLSDLISKLDPLSCRYLVRIPTHTLRLGFSDMTILDAFSWMLTKNKSLRLPIEKAYHVYPDLGLIGTILKKNGISGLDNVSPEIFTPILMMRAERLADPKAILDKLGPCSIEPKFDGFRIQVHYKKGAVKLYSRNLDDVTYMYPDIVEGVRHQIRVDEAIFEGEAIGFNPNTNDFLPFQETVQRKRKYGIEDMAKLVPLKLFVFELLYVNGAVLLDVPFIERRKKLLSIFKIHNIVHDTVVVAEDRVVDSAETIETIFEDAVTKGLEGIVAKKLNGVYTAGARGFNWIKFKKSYSSKLQDTIDCLIMGYDFGKGKRTGFGIGAFLVGIYDDKKDEFLTVSKIGTGLTDEEWKNLRIRIDKNLESKEKPILYQVDKNIACDVWIKPNIVIEVRADEISRSPIHTAGRVMKRSENGTLSLEVAGYALRFPRLERFRDDKRPEDVTTLTEIETIYNNQGKK